MSDQIRNGQGKEPLEIERKFLIRFPDLSVLERLCSKKLLISQTYLRSDPGLSRRIRRSEIVGHGDAPADTASEIVYWYNEKERITDITRIEREHRITEEEYNEFLKEADPEARSIHKTRYHLPSGGRCFEVDIFPEWTDRAFVEIEMESETARFEIPECLEVIKEVTDDGRYTNAALARSGFFVEKL